MGTETKRTKSRNFNTESPNLTRETLGNVIKGQERRSRKGSFGFRKTIKVAWSQSVYSGGVYTLFWVEFRITDEKTKIWI